MSRPKNKFVGDREARTSKKLEPKRLPRDDIRQSGDKGLSSWSEMAERKRWAWLQRPRLHTVIFADAWQHSELEKLLAISGGVAKDRELFELQQQKRMDKINRKIESLGWPAGRLELFMQRVVAYRKDPSIQNYLTIRHEFPEVEIQVGQFSGLETLFKLEKVFEGQGIDSNLVAAALDADEPGVDALCLRLLELLAARESIPKSGPGHIEKRRRAIGDATVNYLITMILEACDWHGDSFRIPGSLVVLIKYQLCKSLPDLEMEVRSREKKENTALAVAQLMKPDEKLSINKLKDMAGLTRTTAARWLADPEFQSWLDTGRRWAADGLFERAERAARQRLMP